MSLAILFTASPVLADTTTSSATVTTTASTLTTSGSTVTTTSPGTVTTTGSTVLPVVDSSGSTISAGVLPDSPFYWLYNLIQKLQLILTFDPSKKASLAEHQALQKLAGAEIMMHEGKTDAAQRALGDYSNKIAQAQAFLAQIQDPNSSKAKELEAALSASKAKNITVLAGLLDKLPPQAAQRIAVNMVRSMAKDLAKYERKHESESTTPDTVTTTPGTVTTTPGSVGWKHKPDIAEHREKGQRGVEERDDHSSLSSTQQTLSSTQQTLSSTQQTVKSDDSRDDSSDDNYQRPQTGMRPHGKGRGRD